MSCSSFRVITIRAIVGRTVIVDRQPAWVRGLRERVLLRAYPERDSSLRQLSLRMTTKDALPHLILSGAANFIPESLKIGTMQSSVELRQERSGSFVRGAIGLLIDSPAHQLNSQK